MAGTPTPGESAGVSDATSEASDAEAIEAPVEASETDACAPPADALVDAECNVDAGVVVWRTNDAGAANAEMRPEDAEPSH